MLRFLGSLLWLVHAHFPAPAAPALNACAGGGGPAAHAFAVVDRVTATDTLATITICLVSDAPRLRVGGYHGELTLPVSIRVVRVERPSGGTRIENTTVAGRVSFAGVASEGIQSGAVLGLTVARRSASEDARIRLAMIDVTDVAGREVGGQFVTDSLPRVGKP
ncbi:MAG TPA: hypothetical protein VN706_12095 [Gemmatimonadaceae bacterium]|nr:hypothetical protein [Gemmatimonadaceae bacterium]